MPRLALAAALLCGVATSALAFDPARMTEAERSAFGAAVRDYLMDNPQVLLEAIDVLETRQQAEAARTDRDLVAANRKAIFEDGQSWVGGNPQGDVTVVEFIDYRCTYCRKAYEEVNRLIEGDGKIRFIVKEFPILGEDSEASARFAIAVKQIAGDGAYSAVHDKLVALRGPASAENLTKLAREQGLDAAAVLARMQEPEVTEVIRDSHALAQALGISGTPAFVIGGQMMKGYAPLEAMQAIVREERG